MERSETTIALEGKDPPSSWVLPPGAQEIVLGIAAERLLFYLLQGQPRDLSHQQSQQQQQTPKNHMETEEETTSSQAPNDSSNNSSNSNSSVLSVVVDFVAVRYLVEHYPAICRTSYEFPWEKGDGDTRRLYPLAKLSLLKPPLELIQLVYRAFPEALTTPEPAKGCIPLHYACSAEGSLELVTFLLAQNPSDVATPRHDGMLPLHLAAYFKASLDIVEYLLEQYPEAIEEQDTEDWTPLHSAARGHADLSVVSRLYDLYPHAIVMVDDQQRTPLHLACMKRGQQDVVEFLYNRQPTAFAMEDVNNLTPLFHAAKCQSVEGLQMLLRLAVEEGQRPADDHLGGTLLHFATVANTPDVVDYLCTTYPTMIVARSSERMQYTALHVACLCDAPVINVQTLLRRSPPDSLFWKTDHLQEDCLQIARKSNASSDLIDFLKKEMKQQRQRQQQQQRSARIMAPNGVSTSSELLLSAPPPEVGDDDDDDDDDTETGGNDQW